MKRNKIVAILLANAVTSLGGLPLTENMTDEQLNALPEAELETALNGLVNKPAAAPAANVAAPATTPVPATTPAPVANNIVSVQDFIKQAPKEMQEVLNNSLSVYNDEKVKLIDVILANKRNGFTKAELENRPLGELKMIARLAADEATAQPRTANFAGQAPVPVGNAAEEALELPTLNFAKK